MSTIRRPGDKWTMLYWKLNWRFPFLHLQVRHHTMDDDFMRFQEAFDNASTKGFFRSGESQLWLTERDLKSILADKRNG